MSFFLSYHYTILSGSTKVLTWHWNMGTKTEIVLELALLGPAGHTDGGLRAKVETMFAMQLPQLELLTYIQASYSPGKITTAPDTAE